MERTINSASCAHVFIDFDHSVFEKLEKITFEKDGKKIEIPVEEFFEYLKMREKLK